MPCALFCSENQQYKIQLPECDIKAFSVNFKNKKMQLYVPMVLDSGRY